MKKTLFYVALAMMGIFTSCSSDDLSEGTGKDGKAVKFGATINNETGLSQKTVMSQNGDVYDVKWSAGDKVVVNGAESAALTESQAGSTYATFTVEGVEGSTYKMLYPASVYDAKTAGISVPSAQSYAIGSFGQGSAVMVGQSNVADEIAMKHLFGFIKVTVSEQVKAVYLTANGGEALAGDFAIDYENASLTAQAGQNIIRITDVPAEAREFIISVPAANYTKGFGVKVYTETAAYNFSNEAEGAVEAGYLYDLGTATLDEAHKVNETLITNATELQAFLTAASTMPAEALAVLGNDIDLQGVTLTGATSFAGTFDGQGYSIKNWTSEGVALIGLNTGTVKNITLDASCKLTYPDAGYFGFLVSQNGDEDAKIFGTVSGCVNNADITGKNTLGAFGQAALVGKNGYGTVVNCLNTGNISVNTADRPSGNARYGTVVAYMYTSKISSTINCVNKGNLDMQEGVAASTTYVGGVVGTSNNNTITRGCVNYGDITYRAVSQQAVIVFGGITAYSAAEITDCTNYGNLKIVSKSSSSIADDKADGRTNAVLMGGIAGYDSYDGAVNDNNYGKIEVRAAWFGGRTNLGGLYYNNAEKSADGCMIQIGGCFGAEGSATSIDKCNNYGDIDIRYNKIEDASSNAGRYFVAGIVGTPWGNVSNCVNEGNIHYEFCTSDGSAFDASNRTIGCAGIVGGDYCALTQNTCNVTNCVNNGEIYVKADGTKSNSTIGGIISWPGIESTAQKTVTENCVNNGNITVEGSMKVRVGGIHGGSGNLNACTNNGNIYVGEDINGISPVGGIAGFHSQSHYMRNCVNNGNVTALNSSTYGVGGLIGYLGNYAGTFCENCKVNATVTSSSDDNATAGMVVGWMNGTTKARNVGAEDAAVKVKGTLNFNSTPIVITSENISEYGVGTSNRVNDLNKYYIVFDE